MMDFIKLVVLLGIVSVVTLIKCIMIGCGLVLGVVLAMYILKKFFELRAAKVVVDAKEIIEVVKK